MRQIRTAGLMSGDGKRGGAVAPVLAPILDSTGILRRTSARMPTWQPERLRYGCTLKRQPRAKLEGARAAGAEDVAEAAGGLAEARGQQVVFVAAEIGGVQQVENFAEELPFHALAEVE